MQRERVCVTGEKRGRAHPVKVAERVKKIRSKVPGKIGCRDSVFVCDRRKEGRAHPVKVREEGDKD